ncbi:hypothetical protein ACMFMG_011783 [Clarireedia jacksonii]
MTSSFDLFPKLPPELREKIWMKALTEERVIIFDFNSNLNMWLRSTPEPVLFHVNRESNNFASKYYKRLVCEIGPSIQQTTHLDPDHDICYFLTPKGVDNNEKMYYKMETFFDNTRCNGVRPRRWAFDMKLLISLSGSSEYRSVMWNWNGHVLKRMSWCHALLGNERVDEFCIRIRDEEVADTIHHSNKPCFVEASRDSTQKLSPRLKSAKEEFQKEILIAHEEVEMYRGSDGCSKPPIVSYVIAI